MWIFVHLRHVQIIMCVVIQSFIGIEAQEALLASVNISLTTMYSVGILNMLSQFPHSG